jgi:dTDP-glucose pyrophosphorylase
MKNAIIPCAGFGTRMNMSPNQSKELIIDYTGLPIIDYSLGLCRKYNLHPVIITRPEKKDLIEYLKNKDVTIILHDGSGEWPTSILKAKSHWSEEGNILILPDTRFAPESVIPNIMTSLDLGVNATFALHKVDDISKWGSIKDYAVTEKSQLTSAGHAWGIIGFQAHYGEELFTGMRVRNVQLQLTNTSFLMLDFFKDITRGTS